MNTLTRYCSNSFYGNNGFTDGLTELLSEDDAATANWGSEWRMPTREEWRELHNHTSARMTTQNGVYGILFTATNSNSLFLPAAGNNGYHAGSDGYYWSNTLNQTLPYEASYCNFASAYYGLYGYPRCEGFSVRPVRSAK